MKKRLAFLLFAVCIFFSGCKTPTESGRGTDAVGIFYGDDNGRPLHNPLMGWSYYGFPEEIIQKGIPDEFDVGIILCSWDRLEPGRGRFDFSSLTAAIERLKRDDKTVYLRLYLMPDNVWKIKGYPDWVKSVENVGTFKPASILDGAYRFEHPDYANKVYQGLVETFLTRLAEEYKDGAADVIDARAYGLYGEWDSNWGNYWDETSERDKTKKTAVLNDFVNVYGRAFAGYKDTKIAINVPSVQFVKEEEKSLYEKEAAYDNAMEKGFALRYDGIENAYPGGRLFFEWLRAKNYPAAPVFAETVWGTGERNDPESSYLAFCAARANIATFGFYEGNYRKMYELPYDYYAETLKPSARFENQVIGYRILPSRIRYTKETSAGGALRLESTWINTGCGVLYRHYPLCVRLQGETGCEVFREYRPDFDLTGLTKESGEYAYNAVFPLPDGLLRGTYTLTVSLVGEYGGKESRVALPLGKGDFDSREYEIGKVKIR